mgnify:CR=1 FL=1
MGQRGSRKVKWRMGPWAFWRPPATWRRVLRTIFPSDRRSPRRVPGLEESASHHSEVFSHLGRPSMEEGRGAKHSPPDHIGISCIIYHENHDFSNFVKIIMDHPGGLRNTLEHL